MNVRSALGSLLALCLLGCGAGSDSPYVRPGIAADYQKFYESGPSDPESALAAIDRAIAADPQNAYSFYLKASLQVAKDLPGAFSTLESANQLPKTVVYVSAAPPEDPMNTVSRLRQLGFTADRAETLGEDALRYIEAVRAMGKRLATAEPVAALPALNGSAIVRKSLQAEKAYWQSKKDMAKAEDAGKRLAEFQAWYDKFSEGLASSLKDMMGEAAKAAGLTEEEAGQYARGMELSDRGKQAKADEARRRLYAEEVEAIRKGLADMP